MERTLGLNELFERAITTHWDLDALSDYHGVKLQYHDVARKIEKMHIFFESCGVVPGDKIAICGRNSANWCVDFLATLTYGAVAVPLLHEFTPDQIHHTVNHSDAKILFVGDHVATVIDPVKMPKLQGIINIPDNSIVVSRTDKLTYAREHLNEIFGQRFPKNFRKEHIHYYKEQSPDELALINYTSGTTGFSKGVMLPYRAIWNNIDFAMGEFTDLKTGDNMVSMLPLAHMYGLAFEFLFPFVVGAHVHFLSRLPSPVVVGRAFATQKPTLIISVPLVVEKMIRKKVFPSVQTIKMRMLLNLPGVKTKVKEKIRERVYAGFGGELSQLVIGGAALSKEVDDFLKDIQFPFTVGYGATECAPLITYVDWQHYASGSCGRMVQNMEMKIESEDPQTVPGEILVRGMNVMLGYYKNEEETARTLDGDGWYHTGDLGLVDSDGNLFIKGRSKNMLLGSNGQNIYPEEIEDKLNSLPMVAESVVVQRGEKLVALVYPDYDEARSINMPADQLAKVMELNRQHLNATQPAYCKVSAFELREEEFEKTPKRSIKRYLYK